MVHRKGLAGPNETNEGSHERGKWELSDGTIIMAIPLAVAKVYPQKKRQHITGPPNKQRKLGKLKQMKGEKEERNNEISETHQGTRSDTSVTSQNSQIPPFLSKCLNGGRTRLSDLENKQRVDQDGEVN